MHAQGGTDRRAWLGDAQRALESGDWRGAKERLQSDARLHADAMAQHLLAAALAAGSAYDEAIAAARRAIELEPDERLHHLRLISTLSLCGRFDEALSAIGVAASVLGPDPGLIAARGTTLVTLRRYEEAHEVLAPALSDHAGDADVVLAWARLAPRLEETGDAVARIEFVLSAGEPDRPHAAALRFALGDLLDRAGRYDEAFERYRQANEAIAVPFNAARHAREAETIVATWTPKMLAKLPRTTRTEAPVFVVGMARSGTSLVEQILDRHPRLSGVGECLAMDAAIGPVERAGASDPARETARLRGLRRNDFDRAAGRYMSALRGLTGSRPVDKSLNNLWRLGHIARMLPSARFVICSRHPWDVCLSCYFQNFGSGGHAYSHRLEDAAMALRDCERVLSHWRSLLPDATHVVSYDALVTDPESEVRALLSFVGEAWDERCLRVEESRRVVATASNQQVTAPIHAGSRHRWRRYASHIEPLRRLLPRSEDE